MNNKQLFEQSAGKILSANQLEGVMKLHNVLFEGQTAEQTAETVATAVKDAVDDAVNTAADEQVIQDVAETPSTRMSLEDQQDLKVLVESMSDNEKVAFLESLDDQQMQILTEGLGTYLAKFFRNIPRYFTKGGRKGLRLDRFAEHADKEVALQDKLDKILNVGGPLGKKGQKEANKIAKQLGKVQQKENDMLARAATRGTDEYDLMTRSGLDKGSRNFSRQTLEAERSRLMQEKDLAIKKLDVVNKRSKIEAERKAALEELKIEEDNVARLKEKATLSQDPNDLKAFNDANDALIKERKGIETSYNRKMNGLNKKYNDIKTTYDTQIKDYDNRINMGEAEGRFDGVRGVNPRAQGYRYPRPGYGYPPGGFYVDEFGRPFMMGGAKWGSLIDKIPILGTLNMARKLTWGAIKTGILVAGVYGGYKVYDFITNPEGIDVDMGEPSGTTRDTVKKALFVLGGGAGGYGIAKLLGVESTAGKGVSALLGALLVAYFTFLSDGDEEKGQEVFEEYKNADAADIEAINEALNTDGLADMLRQMLDANEGQ